MVYEKKYKEALERAKKLKENPKAIFLEEENVHVSDYIFPELKESEDEIYKRAIRQMYSFLPNKPTYIGDVRVEDIFSWLEKQGKQKPVDKVEPKFKVSDWITDGEHVWKIGYIEDDMYIERRGTISGGGTFKSIDKRYHLWTIQDAKDGDVLYSPCLSLLWIFKSKDAVHCGCNLNYNDGAFFGEEFIKMPTDATPATKEQRDLLFQKMHEAGCEWDAEKLELKEIISGTQDKTDYLLKQNEL